MSHKKIYLLFLIISYSAVVLLATDICIDDYCDIENDDPMPRLPQDAAIKQALKDAMNCIDSKLLNMKNPIDLSTDFLKLNLMLRDLKVIGLNSINTEKIKFNVPTLSLLLNFKFDSDISIETLYSISSIMGDDLLRVYGEGLIRTIISNIAINAKVKLTSKNSLLSLVKITLTDLQPKKDDVKKFEITGLMNDELTSKVISSHLPQVIEDTFRDLNSELIPILENALKTLAASFIDGKTLKEITKMKINCTELLQDFYVN